MIITERDFWSPIEWARYYRSLGWQAVPATHKMPGLAKWVEFQNEIASDETFASVMLPRFQDGVGIICGKASGGLFAIDLDRKEGDFAFEWWSDLMNEYAPGGLITPNEVTPSGGLHYYFRAPDGWTPPTLKTSIGVDVRGQGGFIVCAPTRRGETVYKWRVAPHDEPVAVAPQWLVEAIMRLQAEYAKVDGERSSVERTDNPEQTLNDWGYVIDGRETMARDYVWAMTVDLHRECPIKPGWDEYEARLKECFDIYARKVRARHPDGLEAEGRGWGMFRRKGRNAWDQWDGKVAVAAQVPRARPTEAPHAHQEEPAHHEPPARPPPPLVLRNAFPLDRTQIPTRDWVIPGLLIRRHVSLLVAPGGAGKSLLTTQIGIATAAGQSWGGWYPRHKAKTLIINAEDDYDELCRRMAASIEVMEIGQAECEGRLMLVENADDVVVAKVDGKTKTVIRTPLVGKLKETILKEGIDVVIVDPFAETFEGDENNNSEVKWVAAIWREIARETGCAMLLVHHTKKYASGMAGDQDAARGGGAIVNSARISSTLFAMSDDEASLYDIKPEDRLRYVRFDDAKANLSLVTGKAKWFRKVSFDLGNATALTPSDEVGVLMPWEPPGLFGSLSIEDINLILDTIQRGVLDESGIPKGILYAPQRKGGSDRWVGRQVMAMAGVDEDKAAAIVKAWLASGLLKEAPTKVDRKDRDGVMVDDSKRPARLSDV